jgi:hypothetical protein
MKDFPVFTTQYGVASLILKEIPYLHTAYITIGDSLEPAKLIEECAAFCRMCGAERVFATGHPYLDALPVYTAMWEMRRSLDGMPETDAALWPVQENTLKQWQQIYNDKVRNLPNGAWMTDADARKMLEKGDGYFIHRGEVLLGIGRASGDTIDWVASLQPGAGRDVVLALSHAITEETVLLTVASVNIKAVKLYENLGFLKNKELSRWFQIF